MTEALVLPGCPLCESRAQVWRVNGWLRIRCSASAVFHIVEVFGKNDEEVVRAWRGTGERKECEVEVHSGWEMPKP